MATHSDLANLVWQIADLLRGPYRPPQYERVMLPLVVLRRFDCVLADTKPKVLAEYERRKGGRLTDDALDSTLNKASGHRFHNRSALDFEKLKGDPDNLNKHLVSYIKGFSANVQRIFEYFEFENEIERMHEANILYLVISGFCDVDLHPQKVTNQDMGLVFENLIRRFNELANETAGDHFTPREVITLMVDLLLYDADDLLSKPGIAMRMLDPACGTGGMLAGAQKYMRDHHADATLYVYGQDYNKRAFATAASDMLMKEVDHNGGGENVQFGDSLDDVQAIDKALGREPRLDWNDAWAGVEKLLKKRGARWKAPEEKLFILDVLKHYTTYATYFRLLKASEDDPNVERKRAARALARFLKLHPHNVAQKTEVMVEHFHAATQHKIGGRAKAMVIAAVNPGDKFELVFKNLLETLFVERMDQNEEIFARFMNDKSFQKVVTGWLSEQAYEKLRRVAGAAQVAPVGLDN